MWAFRGAPRLARPGKMIKNDPVSELPVSYFDHFPGMLNNYQKERAGHLSCSVSAPAHYLFRISRLAERATAPRAGCRQWQHLPFRTRVHQITRRGISPCVIQLRCCSLRNCGGYPWIRGSRVPFFLLGCSFLCRFCRGRPLQGALP